MVDARIESTNCFFLRKNWVRKKARLTVEVEKNYGKTAEAPPCPGLEKNIAASAQKSYKVKGSDAEIRKEHRKLEMKKRYANSITAKLAVAVLEAERQRKEDHAARQALRACREHASAFRAFRTPTP